MSQQSNLPPPSYSNNYGGSSHPFQDSTRMASLPQQQQRIASPQRIMPQPHHVHSHHIHSQHHSQSGQSGMTVHRRQSPIHSGPMSPQMMMMGQGVRQMMPGNMGPPVVSPSHTQSASMGSFASSPLSGSSMPHRSPHFAQHDNSMTGVQQPQLSPALSPMGHSRGNLPRETSPYMVGSSVHQPQQMQSHSGPPSIFAAPAQSTSPYASPRCGNSMPSPGSMQPQSQLQQQQSGSNRGGCRGIATMTSPRMMVGSMSPQHQAYATRPYASPQRSPKPSPSQVRNNSEQQHQQMTMIQQHGPSVAHKFSGVTQQQMVRSKQQIKFTDAEEKDRMRFQVELEFVQCLGNPNYLHFLAQRGYLKNTRFINYLEYLQYWRRKKYIKYIKYPLCLHFLELLQHESFRKEIVNGQCAKFLDDQVLLQWQFYTRKRIKLIEKAAALSSEGTAVSNDDKEKDGMLVKTDSASHGSNESSHIKTEPT